jgi:hypothetical protein
VGSDGLNPVFLRGSRLHKVYANEQKVYGSEVLLTPNIYWLTTHVFMPFFYAMEVHSGTPAFALYSALIFTINGLAYAVAVIVLCVLATRPSWAAIRDSPSFLPC